MSKKNILYIVAAAMMTAALFSPSSVGGLKDVLSFSAASGYRAEHCAVRKIFEPVLGPADYFASFAEYRAQLLSWFVWIQSAALFFWAARGFGALRFALYETRALGGFLFWILFVLVFPRPAPQLVADGNFFAVDFHSHTYYSHDAVCSPRASLRYHERQNFAAFFATEHQNTDSFAHFPASSVEVLPGVQMQTKDGISVLVLSRAAFDGKEFAGKTIKEITRLAHSKKMSVIVPHWWKWRRPSWAELKSAGVDGFEIYNTGYPEISDDERRALADFCAANSLVATAGNDWHGWTSAGDAWCVYGNVASMSGGPKPPAADIIFDGSGRIRRPTILASPKKWPVGAVRIMFEPFAGFYGYIAGLNASKALAWCGWILFFAALAPSVKKTLVYLKAFAAMSTVFCGVYFTKVYFTLYPSNRATGAVALAAFLAAGLIFAETYLSGAAFGRSKE